MNNTLNGNGIIVARNQAVKICDELNIEYSDLNKILQEESYSYNDSNSWTLDDLETMNRLLNDSEYAMKMKLKHAGG